MFLVQDVDSFIHCKFDTAAAIVNTVNSMTYILEYESEIWNPSTKRLITAKGKQPDSSFKVLPPCEEHLKEPNLSSLDLEDLHKFQIITPPSRVYMACLLFHYKIE